MSLERRTRKTKDNHGCEFSYTRYQTISDAGDLVDADYVCIEFPHLTTKTLRELKKLVSKI